MPDHGSNAKADERWSTVWPNLLKFVGPTQTRQEVKNNAEAAIACFLAETHYQAMFYFNNTISKLEEFPQEASLHLPHQNTTKLGIRPVQQPIWNHHFRINV